MSDNIEKINNHDYTQYFKELNDTQTEIDNIQKDINELEKELKTLHTSVNTDIELNLRKKYEKLSDKRSEIYKDINDVKSTYGKWNSYIEYDSDGDYAGTYEYFVTTDQKKAEECKDEIQALEDQAARIDKQMSKIRDEIDDEVKAEEDKLGLNTKKDTLKNKNTELKNLKKKKVDLTQEQGNLTYSDLLNPLKSKFTKVNVITVTPDAITLSITGIYSARDVDAEYDSFREEVSFSEEWLMEYFIDTINDAIPYSKYTFFDNTDENYDEDEDCLSYDDVEIDSDFYISGDYPEDYDIEGEATAEVAFTVYRRK